MCQGSEQFLVYNVSKTEALKEFCEGQQLNVTEYCNVMVEHTYFKKAEEMRDVFLWNQVKFNICSSYVSDRLSQVIILIYLYYKLP